jgi:uncharacterized protein YkwD
VRVRRPVLPALTALLAGALVAGAATFLTGSGEEPGAGQVALSLSGERPSEPGGSSTSAGTTTSSTTSSAPPTTTPPAPPPTTEAPPPDTTEAPPPPPETQAPVTPAAPDAGVQGQVLAITNAERQSAGCGPLTADADIAEAAQRHAADMADREYFEHTTPEGVTFDERIREAGYAKPGAENIAKGAQTAAQVMELWMNSPGHRANILNCDLATIGVGLDRDGFYWVQDFGF